MAKEHAPTPVADASPNVQLITNSHKDTTLGSKLATVAAIGVGVALIEAELIPGMLIGVAAMVAPGFLPKLGNGLRPLVKGAVRAGYSLAERAKEAVAEAGEQFQDIVAEVKAEHGPHRAVPGSDRKTPEHV
jgi:hypothetical protein